MPRINALSLPILVTNVAVGLGVGVGNANVGWISGGDVGEGASLNIGVGVGDAEGVGEIDGVGLGVRGAVSVWGAAAPCLPSDATPQWRRRFPLPALRNVPATFPNRAVPTMNQPCH